MARAIPRCWRQCAWAGFLPRPAGGWGGARSSPRGPRGRSRGTGPVVPVGAVGAPPPGPGDAGRLAQHHAVRAAGGNVRAEWDGELRPQCSAGTVTSARATARLPLSARSQMRVNSCSSATTVTASARSLTRNTETASTRSCVTGSTIPRAHSRGKRPPPARSHRAGHVGHAGGVRWQRGPAERLRVRLPEVERHLAGGAGGGAQGEVFRVLQRRPRTCTSTLSSCWRTRPMCPPAGSAVWRGVRAVAQGVHRGAHRLALQGQRQLHAHRPDPDVGGGVAAPGQPQVLDVARVHRPQGDAGGGDADPALVVLVDVLALAWLRLVEDAPGDVQVDPPGRVGHAVRPALACGGVRVTVVLGRRRRRPSGAGSRVCLAPARSQSRA